MGSWLRLIIPTQLNIVESLQDKSPKDGNFIIENYRKRTQRFVEDGSNE